MTRYAIGGREPTLPDDGSCWIAPGAQLIGDARLGRDTSIWFGTVIRADNTSIHIGDRSNVQEGTVMHSDPGAPLIGMGAIVLNRAVIGDGCLVGAGALVTEGKIFAARSLIVGSPARAVRTLDDAAVAEIRAAAERYVKRSREFATGLRRID